MGSLKTSNSLTFCICACLAIKTLYSLSSHFLLLDGTDFNFSNFYIMAQLVSFNKEIIKDIIEMSKVKVKEDNILFIKFNDQKHKTYIVTKANTESGFAYKGVVNFPVEGIITYNKGNNSIILFDNCYLVWDNRLNIHKFVNG